MLMVSYLVAIPTAVMVGSTGCANPDPEPAAAPAHVVDIDLRSESTVKAGMVPRNATFASLLESVSYTHLTLPTICSL